MINTPIGKRGYENMYICLLAFGAKIILQNGITFSQILWRRNLGREKDRLGAIKVEEQFFERIQCKERAYLKIPREFRTLANTRNLLVFKFTSDIS